MAPGPMAHVFFADSGSVSVEVALKLSLQYQAARGRPEATRGSSPCAAATTATRSAAMSVCDPVDGMHSAFPGVLAQQVFAPRPPAARQATPRRRRALGDGPLGLRAGPPRYAPSRRHTATSSPPSSSSRCCRAPAACTSTTPTASACCARWPTSTGCCSSSTRSRPVSAAPAGSSPPSAADVTPGRHVRRQGPDRRIPALAAVLMHTATSATAITRSEFRAS